MQQRTRVVLAGAIGNVLEWYDFGLYGLLAPALATVFFPAHDSLASLLGAYGGFAVGFAMRPVGALILGYFGDRIGRRFVLALSVVLMGAATVAVGALPTYAAAGIWAPALLIFVRLLQGFSVGGEFVDSVTYLIEAAPPNRRGLAGSVANLGSTAGMLLAAGVAAAVSAWAGWAQLLAWAWRLPFFLGGVLAFGAYFLRRHLPETRDEQLLRAEAAPQPAPDRQPTYGSVRASEAMAAGNAGGERKHRPPSPLRRAMREQPRVLLATLLFTSGYGIANYLTMVFLPTYAHEFGRVGESVVLRINAAGQALALVLVPITGWISDRVLTRRALLVAAFVLEAAISWQAFRWAGGAASNAGAKGAAGFWFAQLGFALLLAIVMGAAPAMLAEQFRPVYRVSAHAVAFNIGIGIAGGTAPMIATALIHATSDVLAPAAYLIFASVLAALSAAALPDRSRAALD